MAREDSREACAGRRPQRAYIHQTKEVRFYLLSDKVTWSVSYSLEVGRREDEFGKYLGKIGKTLCLIEYEGWDRQRERKGSKLFLGFGWVGWKLLLPNEIKNTGSVGLGGRWWVQFGIFWIQGNWGISKSRCLAAGLYIHKWLRLRSVAWARGTERDLGVTSWTLKPRRLKSSSKWRTKFYEVPMFNRREVEEGQWQRD